MEAFLYEFGGLEFAKKSKFNKNLIASILYLYVFSIGS